jgi:preprotein translocase subunit YajC
MGPVLVLVAVGVIAWMLLAVPVRRRQHAHAAMQDAIAEGDEIITAGGLHAFVREAGEQELRVEIAPGVIVALDRRAVAAVAENVPVDDDDVPDQVGALPAPEEPAAYDDSGTADERGVEDGSGTGQTDTS